MEFVAKEEVIGMIHRVITDYLTGKRILYTDKDDMLLDINKSICTELKKLPKASVLEGEFTVGGGT